MKPTSKGRRGEGKRKEGRGEEGGKEMEREKGNGRKEKGKEGRGEEGERGGEWEGRVGDSNSPHTCLATGLQFNVQFHTVLISLIYKMYCDILFSLFLNNLCAYKATAKETDFTLFAI